MRRKLCMLVVGLAALITMMQLPAARADEVDLCDYYYGNAGGCYWVTIWGGWGLWYYDLEEESILFQACTSYTPYPPGAQSVWVAEWPGIMDPPGVFACCAAFPIEEF
jgi:hypothetical protein